MKGRATLYGTWTLYGTYRAQGCKAEGSVGLNTTHRLFLHSGCVRGQQQKKRGESEGFPCRYRGKRSRQFRAKWRRRRSRLGKNDIERQGGRTQKPQRVRRTLLTKGYQRQKKVGASATSLRRDWNWNKGVKNGPQLRLRRARTWRSRLCSQTYYEGI